MLCLVMESILNNAEVTTINAGAAKDTISSNYFGWPVTDPIQPSKSPSKFGIPP